LTGSFSLTAVGAAREWLGFEPDAGAHLTSIRSWLTWFWKWMKGSGWIFLAAALLGLEATHRQKPNNWELYATIMARTEVLEVAPRTCDPIQPWSKLYRTNSRDFSAVVKDRPNRPQTEEVWRLLQKRYYGRRRRHQPAREIWICASVVATARWPVIRSMAFAAPTSRHTHRPPGQAETSFNPTCPDAVSVPPLVRTPNALPDVQRELSLVSPKGRSISIRRPVSAVLIARPVPLQRYFHGAT